MSLTVRSWKTWFRSQFLNIISFDFSQIAAEIPWALRFTEEPADTRFAHTQSTILNCRVEDRPKAQITWQVAHSGHVNISNITGVRYILPNGSLYFPAFSESSFNPSVHRADYQCIAKNNVGTVVSKIAKLRAGNYREEERKGRGGGVFCVLCIPLVFNQRF